MNSTKPIDMPRPTHNDILEYEILSVRANRFMEQHEKDAKIAKLRSEMTKGKN